MISVPVKSSNIRQIAYDPKEATLVVWFHSGAVYMYTDVPYETVREMLAAPSIGKYFHANIRGKFEARREDEAAAEAKTQQAQPSEDQEK